MKILLIYPYWLEQRMNTEDVVVPPIGMYYVGAVLKENHYDVEILNWCRITRCLNLAMPRPALLGPVHTTGAKESLLMRIQACTI